VTRTDLCSVTDKDRNKTIEAGVMILRLLKFILVTVGGLSGLLALLISYALTLDPEASPKLNELPRGIQDWYAKGQMVDVLGRQMFVIEQGSGPDTIILIHGFPTSSYDYHRAIGHLSKNYRVVMFDHLGFGFSDKPKDFSYSLMEQAEQALALWTKLGIEKAHVVSHDMGDSVLTEILTRLERGALPDRYTNFFQSIIFTNGGMRYHLINFRLFQKILKSPLGKFVGDFGARNIAGISDRAGERTLQGIWGKTYSDKNLQLEDIKDIQILNKYKEGNAITYKTIGYLHDREKFDSRWMTSLSNLQLPVMLLWGDDDAVAPMAIPKSIATIVPKERLTFKTMPKAGHFLMLEKPEVWAEEILRYVGNVPNKEHAVVIDAGSTGSRVLAFTFHRHPLSGGLVLEDELWQEKKPGLSSYASEPAQGAASISALLDLAKERIPEAAWSRTPVTLRATAGLRLLPQAQSEALISAVKNTLDTSGFVNKGVDIMSELDEGVFGWLTVNYLLHALDQPADSYVALDLGGGSTQITFAPRDQATLAASPPSYLHTASVFGKEQKLYTHSYLGAGLMAAREGVFRLNDPSEATSLASSCIVGEDEVEYRKYKVKREKKMGASACMDEVKQFLGSVGIDQSKELPTRKTVAFSYFYDRAVDAGLLKKGENGIVTVQQFLRAAEDACDKPDPASPFLCVDLTFISGLLHHGYQLPASAELGLYKKIDGHETSWALGAAFQLIN